MENMCTVRALKVAAAESFGDAALTMQWRELTAKHSAVEGWFRRAHAGRQTDADAEAARINGPNDAIGWPREIHC